MSLSSTKNSKKIFIISSTVEPASAKFFKQILVIFLYIYVALYDKNFWNLDNKFNICFVLYLVLYAIVFLFFKKIDLDTKILLIIYPAFLLFSYRIVEQRIYLVNFLLFNFFFSIFILMILYQIMNLEHIKLGIRLILIILSVSSLILFIFGIRISADQNFIVNYKIFSLDHLFNPFYIISNIYFPLIIIIFLYEAFIKLFCKRFKDFFFLGFYIFVICSVTLYSFLILKENHINSILSYFLKSGINIKKEIIIDKTSNSYWIKQIDKYCDSKIKLKFGIVEALNEKEILKNAVKPQVITDNLIGFISDKGVEISEQNGNARKLLYKSSNVQDVAFVTSNSFVIVENSKLYYFNNDKLELINTNNLLINSVECYSADRKIFFSANDIEQKWICSLNIENKTIKKIIKDGNNIFYNNNSIYYTIKNKQKNIYSLYKYNLFTEQNKKVFEREDISIYFPCVNPEGDYIAFQTKENDKIKLYILDLNNKNCDELKLKFVPLFSDFCFDRTGLSFFISNKNHDMKNVKIGMKKQKIVKGTLKERKNKFIRFVLSMFHIQAAVMVKDNSINIIYTAAADSIEKIIRKSIIISYLAKASFWENERNFIFNISLYDHNIKIIFHSSIISSFSEIKRGQNITNKLSIILDGVKYESLVIVK